MSYELTLKIDQPVEDRCGFTWKHWYCSGHTQSRDGRLLHVALSAHDPSQRPVSVTDGIDYLDNANIADGDWLGLVLAWEDLYGTPITPEEIKAVIDKLVSAVRDLT